MISILLIKKIVELFIMLLSAFLIVKLKLLKAEDSRVITILCIYIVYPCMIINGFLIDMTPEIKQGMILSFCAAFVANVLCIIVGKLYGKLAGASPVEQASIQYPNSGNLIIPIVTSVFGPEWVIYSSAFIAVQNVFIWTFGVKQFQKNEKLNLKKTFLNINMIAIYIGVIFLIAGLKLPSILQGAVSSMSAMAGPCGMMVTGMLIASADLKAILRNRRIYFVTAVRMLVCPLIALALIYFTGATSLAPDGYIILLITFITTTSPTASMVTQLSQLYGQDAVYAGAINIFSTLCCIITMPAFVLLFEKVIA